MEFLFVIIILIMSVAIHEVSHGFAALALGDPTAKYEGRLTLNPFVHLDLIGSIVVPLIGFVFGGFVIGWAKPVPFNPYNLKNLRWGEAIVSAAGALSNILLALVFGLILRVALYYELANQAFFELAGFVVLINITLALFNLMPIPPLDGSKILFALLPYKWQNWRYRLEKYGLILVLLFVFLIWPFLNKIISFLFSLLIGLPM